jgi:hypothetical protein
MAIRRYRRTAAQQLWVSRESQGLEIRLMLGPDSSNAQALLQAMLKHAEEFTAGTVVRTTLWRA